MDLKYHTTLTPERWAAFGFSRQILMIANELNRAGSWLEKNDIAEAKRNYERAFELIYLTILFQKSSSRLKELLRFKELLAELYVDDAPAFEQNAALLNVLIMFDKDSYAALSPG